MSTSARVCSTVAALLVIGGATLSADQVRLRSGQVVSGSFLSADVNVVRLLLANGSITEFPVAIVSAVEFTPRKTATAAAPARTPAPATAPAPDPVRAPEAIMVPKGTVLSVRLTQAIEVDAAQTGMTFKSVLDDPVMLGGQVVVPRGAAVTLQAAKVEQAGSMKGSDKIILKANAVTFGGRKYEVATTYHESKGSGEGKKTARKVGGGAGLGAIVGGIAGGGAGAAIGAVAGAATGAIMSSQGTEHLKLPAETRLQFTLNAAVAVRP